MRTYSNVSDKQEQRALRKAHKELRSKRKVNGNTSIFTHSGEAKSGYNHTPKEDYEILNSEYFN